LRVKWKRLSSATAARSSREMVSARWSWMVWGGIMTSVAAATGIAATVVHGVCRDTATAARTGYPIRGLRQRCGR
jgi:regulator of RNase E activity RraA